MPKKKLGIRDYHELMVKRRDEAGASYWRQLIESVLLWGITGNGPGYYQMAGFWKQGYAWRDKVGHLSKRKYDAALRELNPMNYRKISQHKLPEKAVLTLLGVPTPTFLGYFHPETGRDHLGAPLATAADLERLFAAAGTQRVCFKLVEGWAGRSFEVVELDSLGTDGTVRLLSSGDAISVAELAARYSEGGEMAEGVVVEAYLEQHPEARALNPSSVNTARVWVMNDGNKGVRIELAYMRIGRSGSLVDNQSSGGIVAPIDHATGVIASATDGLPSREEYEVHPDHGARIAGALVPDWEAAQKLAADAIRAFPKMGFAGLDIAFSTQGPCILELNTSPDREGAAFVGRPTAEIFGR